MVGARNNAFTSKEYTAYWARLRNVDMPLAVEILSEMLERPAFRQEEIDSERHVVLEEINMNEDDPTDVAHELFMEALWDDHPLSPPILGTRDSILEMSCDTIAGYWGRRYSPRSTVVAVAGRVDHAEVVELVGGWMGDWEGDEITRETTSPTPERRINIRRRDTEQAHLVFGATGLSRGDDRRHAMLVADHILGGGCCRACSARSGSNAGWRTPSTASDCPSSRPGRWRSTWAPRPARRPTCQAHPCRAGEADGARPHRRGAGAGQGSCAGLAGAVPGGLGQPDDPAGRTELTGIEHLSMDEIVARIEAVTEDDILGVVRDVYSGPYVPEPSGLSTPKTSRPSWRDQGRRLRCGRGDGAADVAAVVDAEDLELTALYSPSAAGQKIAGVVVSATRRWSGQPTSSSSSPVPTW